MYSLGHHSWIPSMYTSSGHIHTYTLVINELAYNVSWIPKYITRASRSLLMLRFATHLITLASLALFATRIFYILHIFAALNVFA